jgi:hypothetical protein
LQEGELDDPPAFVGLAPEQGLTSGRNLSLLPHSRPRVQASTNEDPMIRLTLRPDAIDRLAETANGSFRLSAIKRGQRLEIDRRDQAG